MKDEDIRSLLGGYATGTLTETERELLYTAALKDQHLFDALAGDEALRELLADPVSRRQILDTLDPVPQKVSVWESLTGWMQRPASWAAAGTVIAGLVLAVALRREFPPVTELAMKSTAPAPAASMLIESRPAPESPPPAATPAKVIAGPTLAKDTLRDRRAPAPAASSAPKEEESRMKIAVLDFNAPAAPPAVAEAGKTASDLLGKKLDSDGYAVVARKDVDEVLQEKKLTNKQLDAGVAASVGRVLGADAVIVGRVQTAQQQPAPAERQRAAIIGGQAAAPPAPSQAASQDAAKAKKEPHDVEVTATAIDTKTANNLAVASEQMQQVPGGGLAGTMDRVAVSLRKQMLLKASPKANITGKVTDVTQSFLTLDLGAASGLKVGDLLQVLRDSKPIGRVKITSVKESLSVGEFQGQGAAKAGDTVSNR